MAKFGSRECQGIVKGREGETGHMPKQVTTLERRREEVSVSDSP